MKIFIRCFLIFFLALSLAACSSTPKKRSFGEVVDDAVITTKLKTKFMKDKGVKAHDIDIDTWKGVVSLKGTVESKSQISRAIELAERQRGVRQVKSYLVVVEPRPSTKAHQSKKKKSWFHKSSSSAIEEKDVKETAPQKEESTPEPSHTKSEEGSVIHSDENEGIPPYH